MHLTCSIATCTWISSHSDILEVLIAEYLYHVISDHWEVLQLAHDRPDILSQFKTELTEI